MQERRQYVRLDEKLSVNYAVLPRTGQSDSGTKDIGGGGIRFLADKSLTPGTRLRVNITIPGEGSIPFTGEVIWSEHYRASATAPQEESFETGVRFIKISPEDRELIKRYVLTNL